MSPNSKLNKIIFALSKKQITKPSTQALFVVPVFLFVTTVFGLSILTPGLYTHTRGNNPLVPTASAAPNNTINFQARLLTSTGALVPDGNYHIEFKFYDSLAAGASAQGVCSTNSSSDDCWWRETRTTGNLVAVKNGYISVPLGSVTPFGANIPWDQELWLTMNIGGAGGSASWNGEMSPRMKVTSLPFAQASAKLKGANGLYDADQLAQLGPGSVQTVNSVNTAIRINQTGAGSLLQLQASGNDRLLLAANGNLTVAGTGVFQGASVSIGTTSQAGVLTLSDGSTNTTTIQAAATAGNLTFTLPNAYGGSGDCIVGNGAGGLSFSATCGSGGSGTAPVGASYLTLGLDGTLTNERVLTAGTNITVSDGGANSTLTINVANSPTFSGTLTVQGATLTVGTNSQQGSLVLNDGSNNTTTLQSAAIAGNLTFKLPSGYGSTGECVIGDGAGGLSFSATCGSGGSGTAPVGASYLTLGLDGTLTNERVLTAGTNISISDGGANGSLTVGLTNTSLTVTAGTGLSGGGSVALGSSTTLNLANTAVTANSYGSANSVATFTVDAQGRLTSAATTSIAINGNQITSGSVAVANGGTGATTSQGAINAISQLTTNGDLLYHNGTNSTRLARGTNGQCLTSNGTTLVWGDCNGSGSGNYIQNTTANQNSANFNMQSAATTSVTAKFRAIASQTADIIQIRDNTDTTTVFSVAPNGNLTAGTLNGATITGGTLSTTAVNGVTTANIVLTTGSYADPSWITSLAKSKVGLANVENTALSTWAGSSNITTLGTITSGTWQGTAVGLAYGGTGATTASGARSNLGATTVGGNLFTLTNPSAIRFIQINADNTVSTLDAASFRTAIGAGTSSTTGTVTSVSGSGGTTGLTLTGGAITTSGTLTLGGTLAVANGGTGATTFTSNGIIYGNAGGTLQVTAASTGANQCLITATAGGAPTWGNCNAGGSGFTSLTLTGNSGTNQTINEGDSINIRGDGTVLTAVAGATDTVTLSVVADSIGDSQLQYNTGQNLTTTSNVQFANITGSGDLSIQGNTTIGNATSDRLTVTSQILGGTPLVFQGATDNAYTTSFAFADPTVNQTITFPNATGTVCLTTGNCAGTGGNGDILQGGNSFGAAVTIGANDSFGINLETAGTTRFSIDNTGAGLMNGSLAVAGNFTVNTDKLVVNTTSGNTAIGSTDTTTYKLNVVGGSNRFNNGNQTLTFLTGTNTSGYAADLSVNDDGVNLSNNSASRGYNFKNSAGTLLSLSAAGNATVLGNLNTTGQTLTVGSAGCAYFNFNNATNSINYCSNAIEFNTSQSLGYVFTDSEVRVGSGGTVDTASADGDLYVQDFLEVDGSSSIAGSLTLGTDTQLSRGAADRLDLASGDSFNLVSGSIQQNGINRLTSAGLFQSADGAVGGPSYSFSSDTNTGMYSVAADTLGFATNGAKRLQVSNTAIASSVPLIYDQNANVITYKNVYSYTDGGNPDTGTFALVMPKSWSNTMMRMRIVGYDFTNNTAGWEATIAGYNYSPSPGWGQVSAEITGNAPFTTIRLAHNGTNNVILLGNTTTTWYYPKIIIEEFVAGHTNVTGWETGWSGSFIVNEASMSYIVTPTVQKVGNSSNSFFQNGNSFGATAVLGTNDNNNLDFETNGTTRWSITTAGILQSSGAQTIQTSTGALTIATGGGNGNIVLNANGTGILDVQDNVTFAGTLTIGSDVVLSRGAANRLDLASGDSLNLIQGQIMTDSGNLSILTTGSAATGVRANGLLLGSSYDSTPLQNEIRSTANQNLYLNSRGTGNLYFQTADSTKMTVLNNGNVGIGNPTPSYPLDINSANGLSIGLANGIERIKTISSSVSSPWDNLDITSRGNSAGWRGSVNLNVSYSNGSIFTGLTVRANTDGTSANVGIGTTSPGNRLSVVTSGQDTLPALGANGGKLSLLNDGGAYGMIAGVLSSGNIYMQAQRVDATATAYGMLLQPNGGNVSIGTTDASTYKLSVNGKTQIKATDQTSTGLLVLQASGGTNYWDLAFDHATTPNLWLQYNGSGTPTMYWQNTGNVGLGTSSPLGDLHVGDNTGAGVILDNRQASITSKIGAQIVWAESGTYSAGDLLIAPRTSGVAGALRVFTGTTPTERMTIDGAGATSLSGNLSVTGSTTIAQTADDATYTGFVTNDGGVLKYRTAAQVATDIGAVTKTTSTRATDTVNGTWYRIATSTGGGSGRGAAKIVLSNGGGSGVPNQIVFNVVKDWGSSGAITMLSQNGTSCWSAVRMVNDSAVPTTTYIDAQAIPCQGSEVTVTSEGSSMNFFSASAFTAPAGGAEVTIATLDISNNTLFGITSGSGNNLFRIQPSALLSSQNTYSLLTTSTGTITVGASAGTLAAAGSLTVAANTTLGDANTDTTTVRGLATLSDSSSSYPLRFGADVDLYRGAANRLDLATGDSLNLVSGSIQQNTTTRLTSTGLFQAADGAVGGPAYSFSNDTTTGIYRIAASTIGFSAGGTEKLRVDTNGAAFNGLFRAGGNYYNVVSYNYNGTPTNGLKIKTNIPYSDGSQMPTINIKGYSYGDSAPIDINLVWYVFGGNFTNYKATSAGGVIPPIKLANEGGLVTIHLGWTPYYARFQVNVFAQGMSETPSWFNGWTVADETAGVTNQVTVSYDNKFGTVSSGTWNGNSIANAYIDDNITVNSSGSVDWAALTNYPTACAAGSAVTTLADTPTCTAFAPASGSSNYVQLQGSTPGTQQTGHLNISGTGVFGGSITSTNGGRIGAITYTADQINLTSGAGFSQLAFNYSGQANANFNFYNGAGGSVALINGNNGNITAGTYNGQTISSSANFTGSLAVTTDLTVSGRINQSASGFMVATKDDITTRTDSGFFQTSTATTAEGWPTNSGTWYQLLTSTHSNTGNYYSMQFASNYYDINDLYFRQTNGNGSAAWVKVWHSGNDGSGSSLDADLLDGQHASAFAPASGSSNYIQNQNSVSQTANFRISGSGILGESLAVGGATPSGSGNMFTNLSSRRIVVGDSDTGLGQVSDGVLVVYTNDVERLRINASGNVGIGTNNPGYKLVVDGDHGNTQFLMHSSGDGGATNTADLMLWASEPGHTYTGVGIANNLYNTTGFPRINTNRGGSMMRLLDNSIEFTTVNSSGTQLTGLTLNGSGNLTAAGTIQGARFTSTIATGTAPLTVTSTTKVANLNVDLLDGLDSTAFSLADGVTNLGTVSFTASTTTADFITELESKGAFDNYHSIMKASWSYAGNSDITDTGFGTFELAGSVIETWTDNSDDVVRGNITVRITRPTTGAAAGQVLIYNDQGAGYSPGWRQIWNSSTDGAGSSLDADLLDGLSSSGFIQNQYSSAQSSSNFWISGNGRTDGSMIAGTILEVGNTSSAPATTLNKLSIGWETTNGGWIQSYSSTPLRLNPLGNTISFGGNLLASASSYLNFGATGGSGGYGLRDNAGTIQVKNSGGSWQNISAAVWTSSGGALSMVTTTDALKVNGANAYSYAQSILVNGDLEQWNAANNVPIGYGTFWQAGSSVSRSATHYGNVGSYSAASTFTAGAAGYQRYDMLDSFDVSPGEFIEVSAYGQYTGTAGGVAPDIDLAILLNDNLNEPMFFTTGATVHTIKNCSLTTSWTECRGTFQIPAGKTKGRIVISTGQGNAAGAITTYIDKIQAQKRSVSMVSGNVGIGTSAPLASLSIGSGSLTDTNVPLQVSTGAAGTSKYLGVNKNGGYGALFGFENGTGLGTGASLRVVTTDPMMFFVNNTTKALEINSSGAITCLQAYCPTNSAMRMTPNFHLNSVAGYAVIMNWDNGTTGTAQTLRVGNGAGADAFYVRADGYVAANTYWAGYTCGDASSFCASNWFRSSGGTGWYNASYGAGIYSAESNVVRTYQNNVFRVYGNGNFLQMWANPSGSAAYFGVNNSTSVLALNPTPGTQRVTIGDPGWAMYLFVYGTGGNCSVGNGTGNTACTSDSRKKNIEGLSTGNLAKIMQLQSTLYNWKNDPTGTQRIGLIAQNVQSVYPQAVSVDDEGYLMLDYGVLVSPLIGAVQEQQAMITDAENRLTALENSIQPSSNNILDLTNGGTIQGNLNVVGNLNVTGPVTMKSLTVTDDVIIEGNLTVQNITVANITINGHIITAGNTPTTTIGTAAGTEDITNNIPAPQVTIEGNDTSGTITIVAGANTTAGNLVEVNFSQQFSKTPKVVLTAGNEKTSELRFFRSAETGKFLINLKDAPQTNQTYQFDYFVVE